MILVWPMGEILYREGLTMFSGSAALALVMKMAPYVICMKVVTSTMDIVTHYAKTKISKGAGKI